MKAHGDFCCCSACEDDRIRNTHGGDCACPLCVASRGAGAFDHGRGLLPQMAERAHRDRTDHGPIVNHPQHYGGDTVYEAIKVIEAWELGFALGNAVKYICRAGKKGTTLEDLRKAAWYLNRAIDAEKENEQP